jgi:mono/diheme cytochrome c family protein
MKRAQLIGAMILLGLVALAVLVACGAGAGPAEDTPIAGPSGEGLVQDRCTVCHGLERTTSASKTQQEWEATVEEMRGLGAELTDAEAQTLVDYLAQEYGP